MYYEVNDTPNKIVFQFKKACETASSEELKKFFPKEKRGILWLIKNKEISTTEKIEKEEYIYAFWYGLYGALKGNNAEALSFILNNKKLNVFLKPNKIKNVLIQYKDLIGIPRDKYPSLYDETDYIVPQTPIRHPIDITKPFKVAIEKGNFEIFLNLKDTEIGSHINWESILMGAFKYMNKEIFEKFIVISTIENMVKKHLDLVLEHIVESKNEYAINVLKNHFKIQLNPDDFLIIDRYEKNKEFANYLKLNLIINEKKEEKDNKKIKI